MIRSFTVAAAVAALVVAACAPMVAVGPQDRASVPARPCFLPQTAVNFTVDRDTTAYIRAGRNQVYELRSGGCRGLSAARSISFSAISNRGSSVCVGDTIGLTTTGPSLSHENNSQCRAQVVRQLTDAEVAELPGRLRP